MVNNERPAASGSAPDGKRYRAGIVFDKQTALGERTAAAFLLAFTARRKRGRAATQEQCLAWPRTALAGGTRALHTQKERESEPARGNTGEATHKPAKATTHTRARTRAKRGVHLGTEVRRKLLLLRHRRQDESARAASKQRRKKAGKKGGE